VLPIQEESMFFLVANYAHRLDLWFGKTLGRPYHALLGIGIMIEIVQHCRELAEKSFSDLGIIKTVLAIVLFVVLLVHQAGELSEHAERQRRKKLGDPPCNGAPTAS
jgi:hypothetical protein